MQLHTGAPAHAPRRRPAPRLVRVTLVPYQLHYESGSPRSRDSVAERAEFLGHPRPQTHLCPQQLGGGRLELMSPTAGHTPVTQTLRGLWLPDHHSAQCSLHEPWRKPDSLPAGPGGEGERDFSLSVVVALLWLGPLTSGGARPFSKPTPQRGRWEAHSTFPWTGGQEGRKWHALPPGNAFRGKQGVTT